jgi:ferritin-like metal-binding protein YciE
MLGGNRRKEPHKEARMGLFSKHIKTLDDLFAHGLKDIYYAEHQILRALPKLIESATNPQLKRGLKDHLKETQGQVDRLEQIFQMREEKPKGTKCYGINGLISEGNELSGNIGDKAVLDAGIIAAAQAVEHYEITRYGALIAWAREIGRGDFADILDENLKEEKAADAKLTQIGEGGINSKASRGAPVRKVFARKKTPAARRRPLRRKGASRRSA